MTLNSTPTDEFCECGHSKDEHNETGCVYGWMQLSEDDIIEGCPCEVFVPETSSPTDDVIGKGVIVVTPKNEFPNTKRLCKCGHSESDHHPVFGCVHIVSNSGELNEIGACDCVHFDPAPGRGN